MNYGYTHGAAHGGGVYWGFNWLVHERRPVKADDIFAPRTPWLKRLTTLLNADREASSPPPWGLARPNFSDTSHWVITKNGLGFISSYAEFFGYLDGGEGAFDLIPWSKLRLYLNPHGIVPRSDWNATLPDNSS